MSRFEGTPDNAIGEGISYYILHTEYGPIYLYEKYYLIDFFKDSTSISKKALELREFFTGTQATFGYSDIWFGENCKFTRCIRQDEGFIKTDFMEQTSPHEFLNKISPYLLNEDRKKDKMREFYKILELKEKGIGNTEPIMDEPVLSNEERNKLAERILEKHLVK